MNLHAISRAGRRGAPSEPPGILDDLLCIDGVTDLAVYRHLTGRSHDLADIPPPPRPQPPQSGDQLGLLIAIPGGTE